ncbi:MAG TPA: PIG-L family deacetylase, partial [Candidatus Hydrogenedentes bacterium]|nr:PIG-L family deacetylase [Candidatus Hydrogenedentota bacterium]
FDSQICGGKRYDLATMGRRKAHATYFASHGVDVTTGMNFAMDLTPLVADPGKDPAVYVQEYIQHFADEVGARLAKLS